MSAQTEDEEFEFMAMAEEEAKQKQAINNGPIPAGHGMGDLKMAEQSGPSPYVQPDYLKAPFSAAPSGTLQTLKPVARFAGDVAQTLSTGPINAAAQGIQDNWRHPLDATGAMIGNEVKNLANPIANFIGHPFQNPIQSSEASLERMGVPNEPSESVNQVPGFVMQAQHPENPGAYQSDKMYPVTMKSDGMAKQIGFAADNLTPLVGVEAIRASGLASRAALDVLANGTKEAAFEPIRKTLNSSGMRSAAEKAVLDNYAPRLRAEFAPENVVPGALENASGELANTLKANDLLHPPEQAKINLNSGLDKVGRAIDKTIKQVTEADATVNAQDVLKSYATTTRSLLNRTGKHAAEIDDIEGKILPKIQAIVEKMGPDEAGNIPVDKAVEFRRALQSMVKNWDGDNKNLAQIVAKKLSSSMNEKIVLSHPIYGPRLAKLNEKYAALKDAEPLIDEGFSKAYANATGLTDNSRGLPHTKEGIVTRIIEGIKSPRESLMKMRPELADRIANDQYLPSGSSSSIPDYIAQSPTVTAEELSALGSDIGPQYHALSPRTPGGRFALDKPSEYIQQPMGDGSIAPRQPIYPRRSLDEPVAPPVLKSDVLSPRIPIGNIPSNFPPPNIENPKVAKVLNEAGRRPIVLNDSRIKMLNEALKKVTTKEAKDKLRVLLRAENYKIPLSEQGAP